MADLGARGATLRIVLSAIVIGTLMSAVMVLMGRPPCLIVQTDPYACLDSRLTSRADARVLRVVQDVPDGEVPYWVVRFLVDGQTIEGRIPDWPAPDAPSVGDTATVAYDPAAPSIRVTPADALAEYRAKAAEYANGSSLARWTTWALATTLSSAVILWLGDRIGRRAQRTRGTWLACPPPL